MTEEQKQAAFLEKPKVVLDIDYAWVIEFVRTLTLNAGQE